MISAFDMTVLSLPSGSGPLPPPPTRAELIGGRSRLQGVTVETQQYGTLRAFGPEINMLDVPEDRQAYYAAQMDSGTTVLNIGWAGFTYTSGDGFTYPVPGPGYRWVHDLTGFCERIAEILRYVHPDGRRFTGALISLPGDGHTGVDDNPFGYQWLMANVQLLTDALHSYAAADLTDYCVLLAGYDGTIWNWLGSEVYDYGVKMRGLVPNGCLAVLFPAGSVGPYEGKEQYLTIMLNFDLLLQQVAYMPWSNMDQMWQIIDRFLGPAFVRPPDMPKEVDPSAPFGPHAPQFLISEGTPRGPYGYWVWEGWTYGWVRWEVTPAQVEQWCDYIRAMGTRLVG